MLKSLILYTNYSNYIQYCIWSLTFCQHNQLLKDLNNANFIIFDHYLWMMKNDFIISLQSEGRTIAGICIAISQMTTKQNQRIRSSAAVKCDVTRPNERLCVTHTNTHTNDMLRRKWAAHSMVAVAQQRKHFEWVFLIVDNSLFVAHSNAISLFVVDTSATPTTP